MTTPNTHKKAKTPTHTGIPAQISSDYEGNFGLKGDVGGVLILIVLAGLLGAFATRAFGTYQRSL